LRKNSEGQNENNGQYFNEIHHMSKVS